MALIEEAKTKGEFIEGMKARGWRVTETKINETDFSNIVTLSNTTAGSLDEAIAIKPPSDSRLVIWEGARFWAYFGDNSTAEIDSLSRVAMTLQRVDSTEDPIDSGIYDNVNDYAEDKVYKIKKRVMVVAGNTLRIKVNAANVGVNTADTKFAVDALIIQRG